MYVMSVPYKCRRQNLSVMKNLTLHSLRLWRMNSLVSQSILLGKESRLLIETSQTQTNIIQLNFHTSNMVHKLSSLF